MDNQTKVIITDIKMPFLSMVTFMVKWAIATIPAVIILVVIWMVVAGMLAGLAGWPGV
jgi:hypothetical protein